MEHKATVSLSEDELRSIAMAIDGSLKEHGIQVLKQFAPIMDILDAAMRDLEESKTVITEE